MESKNGGERPPCEHGKGTDSVEYGYSEDTGVGVVFVRALFSASISLSS